MRYGVRDYGINLVWGGTGGDSAFFVTQTGAGADVVRYGDKVALAVIGPDGYLKYGERSHGINLVWSRTPVFEWEVRGGTPGVPASYEPWFGLYNTRNRAYLVRGARPYGINLVWSGAGAAPATADLSHTFRMGSYNQANRPTACTGTVTWTFTPVTLTGTTGRNTALTFSRPFNVTPTTTGADEFYCQVPGRTGDFRLGRWKVTAVTGPSWQATCERDLHGGNNGVTFTASRSGCTT